MDTSKKTSAPPRVDASVIEAKTRDAIEKADGLKIVNAEKYELAGELLQILVGITKEIDQTFDPISKKLHEAKKEVLAQKNRKLEPIKKVEGFLRNKRADWRAAEEEKRKRAEQEIREKARKQEEDARLAEAEALEAEGKKEEAEAVLDEPIETAALVVQSSIPKQGGISAPRKIWKFRITDATKIPREYLTPDEVKIGGVARALKEQAAIPGVEVYFEEVEAVGSK